MLQSFSLPVAKQPVHNQHQHMPAVRRPHDGMTPQTCVGGFYPADWNSVLLVFEKSAFSEWSFECENSDSISHFCTTYKPRVHNSRNRSLKHMLEGFILKVGILFKNIVFLNGVSNMKIHFQFVRIQHSGSLHHIQVQNMQYQE